MKEKYLDNIIESLISVKRTFFRSLAHSGETKTLFTPSVYFMMVALEKHGSLSMSEIGKLIFTPKPNVTLLIDKLISENLAERIHSEKDRRIINIKLTKQGLKIKKEMEKLFREKAEKKLSCLTEKEIKELSDSLAKIKVILSKIKIQE